MATAIGGYLPVQSRPERVNSRTVPRFEAGVHAVSVVFNLVQPVRAAGRRIDQLAELRLDPSRETGHIAPRPVSQIFGIEPESRSWYEKSDL